MSALDRELKVLRGMCSCLGDDAAVDEAERELAELRDKYASAVRTLQDIAAMGKKAGSESAAHRLAQLGEPREP